MLLSFFDSYYPLFPPAPGVNVDFTHFDKSVSIHSEATHVFSLSCRYQLPITPDIVITPSKFAPWACVSAILLIPLASVLLLQDAGNNVISVNPGKLTKGLSAGTY